MAFPRQVIDGRRLPSYGIAKFLVGDRQLQSDSLHVCSHLGDDRLLRSAI